MWLKYFTFFLFLVFSFSIRINKIYAANFQMQTGYYVGTGTTNPVLSISNIGFQPNLVIIKSDAAGTSGAIFKTSAMPSANTAYFGGVASNTSTLLNLNSTGFSIGTTFTADTNTANTIYKWAAFSGSDCTSNGTFCVGTFIGTGSSMTVTTGFQPDLVLVKASTTTAAANWRSSSMPTNYAQFFSGTAQNTTGAYFTTLNSNGFTVGATNSTSSTVFYYVAFKNASGVFGVGTYNGNATDNTNISATNFTGLIPNFVFVKGIGATAGVFNITDSFGDYSNYFSNTANLVDSIQTLQSGGFQIGTNSTVNAIGNTMYYAAFGGAQDYTPSSTFNMQSGYYVGNGSAQTISGLNFNPDLVIVKDVGATYSVFRTSLMGNNSSAYFSNAVVNTGGAITNFGTNNFSIGTTMSGVGDTFYWQAFGNAFNPLTNTGSSDFFIGAYTGNGIDSRNIKARTSFQPNLIAIKKNNTSAGVFKTSTMVGETTSYFGATADASTDFIQTFNSDGFQVGTNTVVNATASVNWWFGFKNGPNFTVNNYTGNGSTQNITTAVFQPDLVWVKGVGATATSGVFHSSNLIGNFTQYFSNTANAVGKITAFLANGFSIGNSTETNTNLRKYNYVAWQLPNSQPTINSINETPDPVSVGNDITFNANWSDSDSNDTMKMFVCKTDAINSQSTGGCTDGSWFFSNSYTSTNPQTGIYTVQSSDVGTNNFYIFICDSHQASNSCSVSSSGTFTVSAPVSVTITSDGVIDYGILPANTSKSTIDLNDTQTVKNDSTVSENFNIKTSNATGGTQWTLGSVPNNNIFTYEFSTNSGNNWTKFINADNYQTLVTNISANSSQDFDLRFTTPTASDDFQQKNITITIQAVQP
jgi:hypothetical protein